MRSIAKLAIAAMAVCALSVCSGPAAADCSPANCTIEITEDDIAKYDTAESDITESDIAESDISSSLALAVPNMIGMAAGLVLPLFRLAPKTIARFIVPPDQFDAFDNIITRESGWNTFAVNPSSGAYGLPQALPPHKMASHGLDWPYNPVTQIRWAYDYMNKRYGSPNAAWAFWQAHGWY
ncbi:transglycosylase SLT domain-containing protein [Nocardia sp. CDC159]|uniref:Transglycosylase SLT domain-containing protein n=1 Tax=Nocardia pulmonis TaxID=2951408 RepID=A0A9X2EGV4_9NOCA|nr:MULTISPECIES: transglycosylase SLT domain-containing protein [Nocardia]MCM6778081.1 transglycosylase SLT domain-containing protein [Nocardia pulmonis]MCM6790970.1 transglycosylase SLT domain-containing protein [Nocardia sp. CDC159]